MKSLHKDLCCIHVPQGDGIIRYYELSAEKPYINFLMEYRSPLPQKGLGEIHTHTHKFVRDTETILMI